MQAALNENKKVQKAIEKGKNTKETEFMKNEKNVGENKKSDVFIYLGPTIPNNILNRGMILKGVPKQAKEFLNNNPIFGKLMVKPQNLAVFKKNLNVMGSYENSLYCEAVKRIKESEE